MIPFWEGPIEQLKVFNKFVVQFFPDFGHDFWVMNSVDVNNARLFFATRVDAECFRARHPALTAGKHLVRAQSAGDYVVSFHDASWLDYLRLPHSLSLSTLDEIASHYWGGTLVEEIGLSFHDERWREPAVIEALFVGRLAPLS